MAKYTPSNKIKRLIAEYWKNPRMYDYCISKLSNELELENGLILKFEKPSIETYFCYGYALNSSDSESYDNATESVEHAKSDIVHFIDANVHESMIKYYYDKFRKAEQVFYAVSKDGLLSLDQLSDQEDKRDYKYEYGELSKSDIQKILNILAEELQKFVKRLNTYLKRYGLSKVHSWSYWRDE